MWWGTVFVIFIFIPLLLKYTYLNLTLYIYIILLRTLNCKIVKLFFFFFDSQKWTNFLLLSVMVNSVIFSNLSALDNLGAILCNCCCYFKKFKGNFTYNNFCYIHRSLKFNISTRFFIAILSMKKDLIKTIVE